MLKKIKLKTFSMIVIPTPICIIRDLKLKFVIWLMFCTKKFIIIFLYVIRILGKAKILSNTLFIKYFYLLYTTKNYAVEHLECSTYKFF